MRQFLHRELIHVILVHELQDIYFPRLVEIKQCRCKPSVDVQQGKQPFLQLQVHEVLLRLYFRVKKRGQRSKEADYLRRPGQLDDTRLQLRCVGSNLVWSGLGIHLPQEVTGEVQEDATVSLSVQGPFIHCYMVVTRDIDTLPLPDMYLFVSAVQDHLSGIHVIHRILP